MKNTIKGITLDEWQRQFTVMWDYYLRSIGTQSYDDTTQLYHCTADLEIYRDYVLLTSYSTLVAIYHIPSKTVLIRGRYSATTDQHVHKFLKWLRTYQYEVQYTVFDYVKSNREIGYDLWDCGVIKYYKRDGVCYTDRSGERYPLRRVPCYPCNV